MRLSKPVIIVMISMVALWFGSNFMHFSNVSAQVVTGNEESDVYLQLSDILNNTKKDLGDVVQAINSGQKDNALNIISNVTMNINEIENGLSLLVDNPYHGGD